MSQQKTIQLSRQLEKEGELNVCAKAKRLLSARNILNKVDQ